MSHYDLNNSKSDISDQYGRNVYDALRRLSSVTSLIEAFSIFLFASLLLLLICIPGTYFLGPRSPVASEQWALLASVLFVMNMMALLLYERLRRNGDTLFSELSDELQWNLAKPRAPWDQSDGSSLGIKAPNLLVRIILRRFLKNTDLPLMQGSYGVQFYFLANLLSWAICLLLSIRN